MPISEVEQLTKIFKMRCAGEVLAFIGPNGAGKSTPLRMLTGILRPDSGQARVPGLVPREQRRRLAFHTASVSGQKSQLWYHLPSQDTFHLLARSAYRKRHNLLIKVCAIAAYLRTPARKLSLELAAALLHRPSVVFLDGPTIGLDVIARQRIRDLIGPLNAEEGLTVILSSYDAGDIEQVLVINQGEIALDAPVARLSRDYLHVKTVELLLAGSASAGRQPRRCSGKPSHARGQYHAQSSGSCHCGAFAARTDR